MRSISLWNGIIFGIVGLLVLASVTGLLQRWRDAAAQERARQPATSFHHTTESDKSREGAKEPSKTREDPAVLEERRARSQARLQAIRSLHRDLTETLEKLEQEVTSWETRIPELLQGNDGRRIAASALRTEQFAAAIEKDHATRQQVQAYRDRLDTLMRPIDRAILDAEGSYLPSDSILVDIEKIRDEVVLKLREQREIKSIVDTLQSDSLTATPSEKSLKLCIDEQRGERLRERAALLAKVKREAHDEETKRLAAAEAKAEQDLANARLTFLNTKAASEKQRIEEQIAAEKLQAKLRAEEEKRQADKKVLEAKFDAVYPRMKGLVIPFTTPGFRQFDGGRMIVTSSKQPMSFSGLRPNLDKDVRMTLEFVRAINEANDRPLGAFPKYLPGFSYTPQAQETWHSVQDFLTEFGDIMVERKLLLP